MNIDDLVEKKKELEADLTLLVAKRVRKFEEDTGLHVYTVSSSLCMEERDERVIPIHVGIEFDGVLIG